MRILVTSDIHGDEQTLHKLRKKERYDLHLDSGDSNIHPQNLQSMQIISVKGNTDFFSNLPLIRVIENELGKILIVHGHIQGVKSGLKYLYELGQAQRANIVIYGHTHYQMLEHQDGIYYLNPGSLRFDNKYAIITKEKIELKELWNGRQN